MNSTINATQTAFKLKAGSLTFTVFELRSFDLELVTRQLDAVIAQTPGFFNNTPVLVDVSPLDHTKLPLDLTGLLTLLKTNNILPIAIRTYNPDYKLAASQCGLAAFSQATPKAQAEPTPDVVPTTQETPETQTASSTPSNRINTMIIDQPIRSGKQIYAKDCDLIITASVSPGAEIIADGNIHVYGSLKGRALAGTTGDETARIFCGDLDAELVAIAGNYLVNEQIPAPYKNTGQLLQIQLKDNSLHFNKV
jgi:septum site-determining protein MinC